jgi:DNA-binding transcriptional regulator YiaG
VSIKHTSRRWPVATALLAAALTVNAALAQNVMPDPNKVPPEYRAAAEKRREELITITECKKLAEKEHVTKRDLAAYINHCKETVEKH